VQEVPSRRFPRMRADAMVLYSGHRDAGRARLHDISEGGLGILDASRPLAPGDHIPLTVAFGLDRVGPLDARVVWSVEGRAGLEFPVTDARSARRVRLAMDLLATLARS
jgi:hypothetical protein